MSWRPSTTPAGAGPVSSRRRGDLPDRGPLVPLLRSRGLRWAVVPGVSFLNAIAAETGEPLVRDGENLFILGSNDLGDLARAYR